MAQANTGISPEAIRAMVQGVAGGEPAAVPEPAKKDPATVVGRAVLAIVPKLIITGIVIGLHVLFTWLAGFILIYVLRNSGVEVASQGFYGTVLFGLVPNLLSGISVKALHNAHPVR